MDQGHRSNHSGKARPSKVRSILCRINYDDVLTNKAAPPSSYVKAEYRPSSGHQYGPSPPLSSRGALPPTPPMHSDAGFEGRRSPSTASPTSQFPGQAPGYYYESATGPAAMNSEAQRQPAPAIQRRVSMPQMGYSQSPYGGSQYNPASSSQYYSSPLQTSPPPPQAPGMYYQRPLPQVGYQRLSSFPR